MKKRRIGMKIWDLGKVTAEDTVKRLQRTCKIKCSAKNVSILEGETK